MASEFDGLTEEEILATMDAREKSGAVPQRIETDEDFQKLLDSGAEFNPEDINPEVRQRAQNKADAALEKARTDAKPIRDEENKLGQMLAFSKGHDFLGISDELAAAGTALGGGNYDEALQDIRRSQKLESERHPFARAAGAVITPMPGVGALKALPGVSGAAARMGYNGMIGGMASGFGDSADDSFAGRIQNAGKEGLAGGFTGAILGAGGKALASGIGSAGKTLYGLGQDYATKAFGRTNATLTGRAGGPEALRQAATSAVDEGIVPWFASKDAVRKRFEDELSRRGRDVGDISSEIQTAEPTKKFIEGLRKTASDMPAKEGLEGLRRSKVLNPLIDELEESFKLQTPQAIPFKNLQQTRRLFDPSVPELLLSQQKDAAAKASVEAKDIIRKQIKAKLSELAALNPEKGRAYEAANANYSKLAKLAPLAKKGASDALTNNKVNTMSGMLGGLAGLGTVATGHTAPETALAAMAGYAGTNLANNFGPAFAGNLGIKGGRALQSIGAPIEKAAEEIPDQISEGGMNALRDYLQFTRNR